MARSSGPVCLIADVLRKHHLTAMFDLSEDELTWEAVGKWTAKDTDLDYSVLVKCQPMVRTDSLIGSSFYPNGKPYPLHVMYFLKGFHLFIATLGCESGPKDFKTKLLIDLTKCAPMTEPVITRKPPRFLSTTERAVFYGEKFFFTSAAIGERPHHGAFTLRFPEVNSCYAWEEAVAFSARLKLRIYQAENK